LDALDASQEMLNQAKSKNIYDRLICDFMGPNKLEIADGKCGNNNNQESILNEIL